MELRDKVYRWWKAKHGLIRKPLVFIVGLIIVMVAPLVGSIPGPGGIVLFLFGIAVLGSEFAWAHQLRDFFLHTVPKEVKKRWQPTSLWEYIFDVTAACLAASAAVFAYYTYWLQFGYATSTATLIFVFNRNRLARLKKSLAKSQK